MSERDLLSQTARMLSQREAEDLPVPRLERRNIGLEMTPVWQRLSSPVLSVRERHALFTVANQLVRNKEEMFLNWGQREYTCDQNPDPDGRCAGQPQSVKHLLQECTRVAGAWEWLYGYLTSFLPPGALSEMECISLLYPSLGSRQTEDCVIWLLGSYFVITMEAIRTGKVVGEQEMRGQLRQKYSAYNLKRMRPLNLVNM